MESKSGELRNGKRLTGRMERRGAGKVNGRSLCVGQIARDTAVANQAGMVVMGGMIRSPVVMWVAAPSRTIQRKSLNTIIVSARGRFRIAMMEEYVGRN